MQRVPAVVISACLAALAWPAAIAQAAQTPHPAVTRIIVPDRDGMTSMGSGALVAVDAAHGLVVTNWHVVRDRAGPITVVFPDGLRYGAIVLRVDQDWDLAALAIRRPRTEPLPVATQSPQPGEPLTIAGYGPDGTYRTLSGRCTNYYSPRPGLTREVVEVDVEARHGDSGGPIFNSRGEIAGVLFGAGGNFFTGGYTMGSYCGRVRQFLAASYLAFQRLPGKNTENPEAYASGSPQRGERTTIAQAFAPQTLPESPRPAGEAASGRCSVVAGAVKLPSSFTATPGRYSRRRPTQVVVPQPCRDKQPGSPGSARCYDHAD